MLRQFAGHEEQNVDSNVIVVPREAWREPLGGCCDTAQAALIKGHRGSRLAGALFDLDEGDDPAATGDQVDFTAGHACPPSENAPAVKPQPPGGQRLGATPARFGRVTRQSPAPRASARA